MRCCCGLRYCTECSSKGSTLVGHVRLCSNHALSYVGVRRGSGGVKDGRCQQRHGHHQGRVLSEVRFFSFFIQYCTAPYSSSSVFLLLCLLTCTSSAVRGRGEGRVQSKTSTAMTTATPPPHHQIRHRVAQQSSLDTDSSFLLLSYVRAFTFDYRVRMQVLSVREHSDRLLGVSGKPWLGKKGWEEQRPL